MKVALRTAAIAGALLYAGVSSAADVYLRAVQDVSTGADGATVWRFVCDTPAAPATNDFCVQTGEAPPTITLTSADDLDIFVANDLPAPVSVVVPGQLADSAIPTMDGNRVRSFTSETAAGASGSYNWPSLRPGSYLFHSGTQPSLQVPMGLFGALVVEDVSGVYPGAPFTSESLLLFSEIDPVQNARVAEAATAGLAADPSCVAIDDYMQTGAAGYPCTIDFRPAYYLVNGESAPNLDGFVAGNDVLLRMINAGLRTHTPAFVNLEMTIYAEDGYEYPNPLVHSQALLAAGKTLDAIVSLPATTDLTIAMHDRSPSFSDNNLPNGGPQVTLQVGNGSPPGPTAVTDQLEIFVTEDTPFDWNPPGGNALRVVGSASHGMLEEIIDGTGTLIFRYTPHADFFGTDAFTYYRPGNGTSYYVTVNVAAVNDDPVATGESYSNTFTPGITVDAPGILANDADADGDDLTAAISGTAPAGLTLNADGSLAYTGTVNTSFDYVANDGTVDSAPVTVELIVNEPSGLVLNVQEPDGTPVPNYRWLVQENRTFDVDPNNPAPFQEQQSLNFHVSYMPVVAEGCYGCLGDPAGAIDIAELALDPDRRYYVSVLPNDAGTGEGHTIGGAEIPAPGPAGYDPVTVIVNPQEIATAQISVFVFEDTFPTNGAPDAPERGLGGFQVIVEDAGGKYGMSGGTMLQDAFGVPLTNSLPCAPPAAPGIVLSCEDGTVLIQDLPPGKYGVVVVPPVDQQNWVQTSTIEGSKVVDAWVKAGEPPFFAEFGKPAPHVFIGWVDPEQTTLPPGVDPGPNTITGNVTLWHDPRSPGLPLTVDSGSYAGLSHTRAWIGLNTVAGDGANIATVQADEDGVFEITGIPNGDYQLVVWDSYLDQIIAFQTVTVTGTGADVGNVPVNAWFSRVEHRVFLDTNENAVMDEGELPIAEQAVNLRWRDGTMNQSFPTDIEGFVPFDEVFPFFHWQLWEIDYARFKPTGMTAIVDAGGTVDAAGRGAGLMNSQYDAGTVGAGPTQRTEQGETVLVQAWQGFAGQTSMIDWGKVPWQPGENGGISGIVSYGSTRGESSPRLTVMDPWEPGIPGVTVNLYREVPDLDPAAEPGATKLALMQSVATDSWDESLPTGCQGEALAGSGDPFVDGPLGGDDQRCYDGWRNWNQIRPGVFDGGYAFTDIPPGKYIVEAVPPTGYQIIKEEDVNVGFGDSYGNPPVTGFAPVSVVLPNGTLIFTIPDAAMIAAAQADKPGIAQPPCVGPYHLVPPELSLFPGEPAPFADAYRPLCTRKEVVLSDQGQAAADFHMFTATPVAAQFTGLITDDIAAEPDPSKPGFGEKFSPPYVPFAIRDFNGREVYRGYSDAFGHYNGILPSTFTANIPIPSGYSPAMMSTCFNDAGNGPDPDPLLNPSYGTACYTWQFMPGTTTYLDTPVLPQAAFAAGFNAPDCAAPVGTPVIASVDQRGGIDDVTGPMLRLDAPGANGWRRLTIRSAGPNAEVPNPAYEGPQATPPFNAPTITRDLGFGAVAGTVTIGDVELNIQDWTPNRIIARIRENTPVSTGQLTVTRGDNGSSSVNAVTVTVSNEAPIQVPADQPTIQAAIDAAAPGELILVAPGVYEELVVMYKPVRLQGSGTSTIINAVQRPVDKLDGWNQTVGQLVDDGLVSLLPGQPTEGTPFTPGLLGNEQGGGITVLARGGPGSGCGSAAPGEGCFQVAGGVRIPSRIDGFTITGSASGGVFVNGYAHGLEISNNSVTRNSGALHGGIRVGHPYLPLTGDGPFGFDNGLRIHNNAVTLNGATGEQSAGGGISLSTGTNGYRLESNFVCGNFAQGDGGGIAHFGLSRNGVIANNDILFNQSYNPGFHQSGGGLYIAGEPPAPPIVPGVEPELLSRGTGNVTVRANRIQGNQAGSGHGGGVRAERINGVEVVGAAPNRRYRLLMDNNIIVNNVAAWSGGGVSLLDAARVIMRNNTIAHNDSTATAGSLLPAPTGTTEPQPAGVSSQQHSLVLAAALADEGDTQTFSNPNMLNNVVWRNRAFFYDGTLPADERLQPNVVPAAIGDCGAGADYWDIGVLGGAGAIQPRRSLLSSLTDAYGGDFSGNNNVAGDPDFVGDYCNGARELSGAGPVRANVALGEGGNFVDVRYGPLTQAYPDGAAPWDYHIGAASDAADSTWGGPPTDYDGDPRPPSSSANRTVDKGADER